MLTQQEFLDYMKMIQKTVSKQEKLLNALEDISPMSYCYLYADEIDAQCTLLSKLMEANYVGTDTYGNYIEYFIYEADWGKNIETNTIEYDDKEFDISSQERLYEFLIYTSKHKVEE